MANQPISTGGDRTRYDGFAIALHWITAVLVVLQFALAETWGLPDRATRHLMIASHMSFGILLSIVIVVRLIWRFMSGHRVVTLHSGVLDLAATAVHWALYILLVAEAILGYVLRWSGNEALSFFGLSIAPPFAPFSQSTHHLVNEAHDWIGWTIVILAAGHAVAALFHHYVLKDGTLQKMLPNHSGG